LQQFFFITFPMLAPTTYFLLTTSFISAMQVFDVVQVMTMGGPNNNTNVLNLYIYQQAFIRSRAGMAAALSVILFILLLLLTIAQRRFSSRTEGQYV
jgi:ABC-type sugar transport system permease subunit